MDELTEMIRLAGHSYPVRIGRGGLDRHLAPVLQGREVAVVTDSRVRALPWFGALEPVVRGLASKVEVLEVPAGEESKNLQVFARLCSELAAKAFSRRTVVVAVGGGVVGDLAGYLAASYLRGVEFVQIPTTLLAAVDSSVGGKTGVNLPEGKNLVGAFHQPVGVVVDLDVLESLPPREFAAGMAEVVKYGVIRDEALFAKLEREGATDLAAVIARCVRIKGDIVQADERETSGERAALNFGHTLGHAIEQTAGYGRFLHGEAVAIGMVAASKLSEQAAGLDPQVTVRLRALLERLGLPVSFPDVDEGAVLAAVGRDKKSTGKTVRWVLVPALGRSCLSEAVTAEMVRSVMRPEPARA
jgi:3-dehydroquinate synthase